MMSIKISVEYPMRKLNLSFVTYENAITEYDVKNNLTHDPLKSNCEKVGANPISKLDFIAYVDNLSR